MQINLGKLIFYDECYVYGYGIRMDVQLWLDCKSNKSFGTNLENRR